MPGPEVLLAVIEPVTSSSPGCNLPFTTSATSVTVWSVIPMRTFTGSIVWYRPARVDIQLPADVATDIPQGLNPEIETVWKLGDQPLQSLAQL